ncbi:RNA polymerase sporulation sigma factor SigK [Lachnoclostridium phytofermentans]|uniref:RNA polymerase sigma factor n=1 Tax=Lachnoclostridium phytofermentans (strain ATCC 700394 / DSM 18823 / ISDg) TaxID=357809 RepID=A9KKR9_LACP7|nr:RNA polymerase sporulation sigma factor SigK [Lachnoclostridium phytofermentans]ABX42651.1 RNA polymerase, sigma 28 subunit, FliA/WhiG family [Lachnoclostridium phytofermentans ISDg]
MKSFPKPLSAKEENEMLLQCKAGNKVARDTLIERNLRLVAHIVKKYNTPDRETDDLISIGTIGLIKSIDTFDSTKGIRLATYASRCIDNELLMMLRSGKKQAREVYLYEPIGSDKEGNEINLLDVIESTDEDIVDIFEIQENIKRLYTFLNTALNEREQEIIIMRYGLSGEKEITQREIADKLGISRSYVSRIEKKALKKLKDLFES